MIVRREIPYNNEMGPPTIHFNVLKEILLARYFKKHYFTLLYHGSKYANLIGSLHDHYFDFFREDNIFISNYFLLNFVFG